MLTRIGWSNIFLLTICMLLTFYILLLNMYIERDSFFYYMFDVNKITKYITLSFLINFKFYSIN